VKKGDLLGGTGFLPAAGPGQPAGIAFRESPVCSSSQPSTRSTLTAARQQRHHGRHLETRTGKAGSDKYERGHGWWTRWRHHKLIEVERSLMDLNEYIKHDDLTARAMKPS